MADGDLIQIPWDRSAPFALGRHIRHDPASRRFAAQPRAAAPTKDKRHRVFGRRLNQMNIGACTGFTGAHFMNSAAGRPGIRPKPTLVAADALSIYAGATARDVWEGQWEPDDTGSSGLAVCQELQARGWIGRYEWAFGFEHGLSVIPDRPLMQGTYWTEDMFYPQGNGQVRPTGSDAGGHEYLWIGVELVTKMTRGGNRSWFLNSWGAQWGLGGLFWMTWHDHAALLERDGDLVTGL